MSGVLPAEVRERVAVAVLLVLTLTLWLLARLVQLVAEAGVVVTRWGGTSGRKEESCGTGSGG